MQELYGAGYVARHLGVAKSAVEKWTDRPTAMYPMPIALAVQAPGRAGMTLWSKEQLPELREWFGKRLALTDPVAYWRQVDEGNAPEVPQGQDKIFDIAPMAPVGSDFCALF